MRAVKVVEHISAEQLRRKAKTESNARVRVRLLAIASVLDGMSRQDAASSAGLSRNALHDWISRYNQEGIPGLSDRPRSGRPANLDAQQADNFKQRVQAGADPSSDGLVAFRGWKLQQILRQEFSADYALSSVYQVLSRLKLRPLKPRPRHPGTDVQAQEEFKKTSPNRSAASKQRRGKRAR
jgi:transposase